MANSVTTRFWTQSQNNSGGIFDHDSEKGIGYALCVEAVDAEHAGQRARSIIESYPASYDCPCCGDRWSFWFGDEDGTDQPTLWGGPLKGGWGTPSYVHFLDGRIEARQPEQI